MDSTDETRKVSEELRRQYRERSEGRTITVNVTGFTGGGPEAWRHEQELRRKAEEELAEEAIQAKMAKMRGQS